MIPSCSASSCPETAVLPDPHEPVPGAAAGKRIPGGTPGLAAGDRTWALETLGRVAEGLVHDFNNVLAAISGLAELMLQGAPDAPAGAGGEAAAPAARGAGPATGEDATREFARMILQAALSGQGLVKDLRAFARQEARPTEVLDLHEVIGQSLAMARGALGGRVHAATVYAPGSVRVRGCRSQLQGVFINLFLNARDAMPRGGRILVSTETLPEAGGTGRPAVRVTVRDAGDGMPPEIARRIFEAGFTTKGPGGSGLGLANVLHSVISHRGDIEVDSAPGAGSAFRILLPRCE